MPRTKAKTYQIMFNTGAVLAVGMFAVLAFAKPPNVPAMIIIMTIGFLLLASSLVLAASRAGESNDGRRRVESLVLFPLSAFAARTFQGTALVYLFGMALFGSKTGWSIEQVCSVGILILALSTYIVGICSIFRDEGLFDLRDGGI